MPRKKEQPKPVGNERLLYLFAYVLPLISGLIVYITEGQRNKRMKFHALQAMFLGIVIILLGYIPILDILALVLWIYGIYVGAMGYDGTDIMIPVLGEYAHKYAT